MLTGTRGFAETHTRLGGLRWLPLPNKIPSVRIGIYWHEKKQTDIANEWLRNFMGESILKGYAA